MSRADAQVRENPLHRRAVGFVHRFHGDAGPVADELRQPEGDLPDRQDEVGEAGRNGAARHRAVFGLFRVLHQNDAAGLLHCLDADRAVRSGAGEDDGEIVAPLRRERAEEQIDRRPVPTRFVEFGDRQMLVGDQKLPVGRNDVDMPRLEADAAGDLGDRHPGARREDARQFALVRWIEVDDDDESGLYVVGQVFKEGLQGANAAGRGADADRRDSLQAASAGDCLATGARRLAVVAVHPSLLRRRWRSLSDSQ